MIYFFFFFLKIEGFLEGVFFTDSVWNTKPVPCLPISKSCLDSVLRFFTITDRGRKEIACKWHLVALCRWQVHIRKLVLSPVETRLCQGSSVLSCQQQHSDTKFATLDQAIGPSSLSRWQQPARGASQQRYATQIPGSMGCSMESSPSCLSLHRYFLLGFLKHLLNTATAFVVCFLCCFIWVFTLLNISDWPIYAPSGANEIFKNNVFSGTKAVQTSRLFTGVINKRDIRAVLWCQLIHSVMIIYLKRNMRTIQRKKDGDTILPRHRCFISDIPTTGL